MAQLCLFKELLVLFKIYFKCFFFSFLKLKHPSSNDNIYLCQDMDQLLNSSPNGVIYFTFGTSIKMDTAPVRLQKAFLEALGKVPQLVLWKYESEILGDLPKNVVIRKWFPQRDILGKYCCKNTQRNNIIQLFIFRTEMQSVLSTINAFYF